MCLKLNKKVTFSRVKAIYSGFTASDKKARLYLERPQATNKQWGGGEERSGLDQEGRILLMREEIRLEMVAINYPRTFLGCSS